LLELLYSTGIRVGELEQVWPAGWERSQQTLAIRHGKGSPARMVPAGAAASQWLMRYVDEARPVLTRTRPYERALFVVRGGTPLGAMEVRGILQAYRQQCYLRRSVGPHALRHGCLLQAGADVRAIQEPLGHASLDSTAIYTRVACALLSARAGIALNASVWGLRVAGRGFSDVSKRLACEHAQIWDS